MSEQEDTSNKWTRFTATPCQIKEWLRQHYSSNRERREARPLTSQAVSFSLPQVNTTAQTFPLMLLLNNCAQAGLYYQGLEKLVKYPNTRSVIVSNHPFSYDGIATRLILLKQGIIPFTASLPTKHAGIIDQKWKENGLFYLDPEKFKEESYRTELYQLMRSASDQGEWLQIFPEGDRSDKERQRVLREGLLQGLTDQPCVFYPITISYQRLPSWQKIGEVYLSVQDPIFYYPSQGLSGVMTKLAEVFQRGVFTFSTDLLATLSLHYERVATEPELELFTSALISRGINYLPLSYQETIKILGLKEGKALPKERLYPYRERLLFALHDLASLPSFLSREFSIKLDPPLIGEDLLGQVATSSLQDLFTLYQYLIKSFEQKILSLSQLEEGLGTLSAKSLTKRHLHNTLRVLTKERVLTVSRGQVLL